MCLQLIFTTLVNYKNFVLGFTLTSPNLRIGAKKSILKMAMSPSLLNLHVKYKNQRCIDTTFPDVQFQNLAHTAKLNLTVNIDTATDLYAVLSLPMGISIV